MSLLLAALLLLPAGSAWASQRSLPRSSLAPVWAGPIVSALEALGPTWLQQQGLRCLAAFEKIRAENGFNQEHNVKKIEFLALELRKR